MPRVSRFFPEKLLKEMDDLEEALEFSGRSELVRASIRLLLHDHKEKRTMSGIGSAVGTPVTKAPGIVAILLSGTVSMVPCILGLKRRGTSMMKPRLP